MTESPEREMYRMRCKHYGEPNGHCHKQSGACMPKYGFSYAPITAYVDINCTPDTNCTRMKRYDKINKI